MNNKEIHRLTKFRYLGMKTVRSYFEANNFIEIDVPVIIKANCVEHAIEPIIINMKNESNQNIKNYLLTSPEGSLKKLLSCGLKKIYSFSHVFRGGEYSKKHKPEFSLIEWYRSDDCMFNNVTDDCESIIYNMFTVLYEEILNKKIFTFKSFFPFKYISMEKAWNIYAHINLRSILTDIDHGNKNALIEVALTRGYFLKDYSDFEDAFNYIMLKYIEPNIGKNKGCVLFNWPSQMSSLAKLCDNDHLFASRFEIYLNGFELANGFNELNNSKEQEKRFLDENKIRKKNNLEELPIDYDFIEKLNDMPNSSGVAMGFDRLLMLILGEDDIKNILTLF